MFDTIGDLPLHPLVVHAVVVGAPLAALLSFLFAIPRTRAWARWPLAIVGVLTAVAAYVAKESGEALQTSLGITPETQVVGPLIEQHSMLADQLFVLLVSYAVLSLLNAFVVTRRSGAVPRVVDRVLPALLVVAAVVVAIWVYRVGDIGARAVWNPTGVAG